MTKIDIFSGFLGAGKTTLIKKLLKEVLNNSKTVLIENEFGEIGIDGGFLKEDSGSNTKLAEYGNNYDKTAYEYDKMIVDSCEGKSNVLHVVVRYS